MDLITAEWNLKFLKKIKQSNVHKHTVLICNTNGWVIVWAPCEVQYSTRGRMATLTSSMQIMTAIEVNSEANFPKLREYCPSAKGTRAIFPQLREISLTIDR